MSPESRSHPDCSRRFVRRDRAGALHDLRSIRKQTNSRVQVRPFLPVTFRTPGTPPGDGSKAGSGRRRDDQPHRLILRESRKNLSTDMAGSTPCGLQVSSKGSEYAGLRPSPWSGASRWVLPHTEGGKGGAMGDCGLATILQRSRCILAYMRTRPDSAEKTMRALRRRQPLLAAWLDALDRHNNPARRRATKFRQTQREISVTRGPRSTDFGCRQGCMPIRVPGHAISESRRNTP